MKLKRPPCYSKGPILLRGGERKKNIVETRESPVFVETRERMTNIVETRETLYIEWRRGEDKYI